MSYWVRMTCPCCKQTLAVGERFEEGGTYVLGGSDQAELNITYNYGKIFHEVLGGGGISTLYGMTGTAAAPVLEAALAKIPDEPPSDDYWASTPGNARKALGRLLVFARELPHGVFEGD
jgi:hypothetical protein